MRVGANMNVGVGAGMESGASAETGERMSEGQNSGISEGMSNGASPGASEAAQLKLELSGIGLSYVRDKRPYRVLDGISLHVREGEFVTLIGPSGSGKSTLFRLIGGVERPDEGAIRIGGRDTTGERGHISYMPQQASLFPWLSVAGNVSSALTTAGIGAKEAKALASQWLERIGLEGVAGEYPHVLSGGMQQRVSFLRALLMPRDVMCLDEPFAALDALTRADMQAWLLDLWEAERRSVLFVTHSIEEALTLSDRIYVLSRAPARVLREIAVPFPRPRRADVWKEPAFVKLKEEVMELLREGTGAQAASEVRKARTENADAKGARAEGAETAKAGAGRVL